MARLLKCYGDCGLQYEKEHLVKISNKNYCKSCAEKKEKEDIDRKTLYKTIQQIYNIPFPTGMMLRQIATFKTERNYTHEGMTMALCYFKKILRNNPHKNAGLAFIPYHYDTAVAYYKDQAEKMKNTKTVGPKVTTIKIQYKSHDRSEILKEKKIIKMEDLLND